MSGYRFGMTSVTTASPLPEPVEPPAGAGGAKKLVITLVIAVIVVLGIKVVFARWWRRGGPRRVITELAEDGAVRIADRILDEVLPAA